MKAGNINVSIVHTRELQRTVSLNTTNQLTNGKNTQAINVTTRHLAKAVSENTKSQSIMEGKSNISIVTTRQPGAISPDISQFMEERRTNATNIIQNLSIKAT